MPINTNISLINQTDIDSASSHVQEIDALLPQLLNLTPREKQKHHNIKNKRFTFVSKTLELSQVNPMVVPAFASLNYLQEKLNNYEKLRSLEELLRLMLEKVGDTAHNEGHFAYKEALKIFDSMLLAKDSNVPGIDSMIETLQPLFAKTKKVE